MVSQVSQSVGEVVTNSDYSVTPTGNSRYINRDNDNRNTMSMFLLIYRSKFSDLFSNNTVLYAIKGKCGCLSSVRKSLYFSFTAAENRLTNLRVVQLPSIRTTTWEIGSTRRTNHKAQRLFLTEAFAPRQHILNLGVHFDMRPARTFPGYQRACLAREIPHGKNMARQMRQILTLEMR